MRSGSCVVQQTLTSEAALVLKNSVILARKRGHAQVTPLHVASTLLTSRVSLLRRACLKSHSHSTSHPLQCRALELCFNVSLNRLPTVAYPLFHDQPSLSNALIAALKRAQAYQRRGFIEQQQQQPLLAVKVELEQLIISVLDDPSVSRVMREAGFSSTSVKNTLENSSPHIEIHSFWQTNFLNFSSEQNPFLFSTQKTDSVTEKEDFRLVLEVLLRKNRRNIVVVGDCELTREGLVAELMKRVDRGEVPDELRSTHFIKFQFSSLCLRFMKRDDVVMKVAELRRKVGSLALGEGAIIIYVGDLKWVVEESFDEKVSCYNPVDHLVVEIGKLISDYSSLSSKLWLMATSSYQTYIKCQMKQPPLEAQWALQAISVPSSGLGLSLHTSSGIDSKMTLSQNPSQILEANPFVTTTEERDKLSCCAECTSNFEKEAIIFKSGQQKPSSFLLHNGSTHLPYWLQPHGADTYHKDDLVELRRKWNNVCHGLHNSRPNQIHSSSSTFDSHTSSDKSYTCASSSPWWLTRSQNNQNNTFPNSNSISSAESYTIEFGFCHGAQKDHLSELSLDSLKNTESKEVKTTLALGNSLFLDSIKSSDQKSEGEMNPQDLCKLLQENVPWQCETIPSIAEALLKSKSTKNGTWLLIRGADWIGKRRLARAIAESRCVSTDHFVTMNMRRENESTPCSKIVMSALQKNENCVVLIEEIDYADTHYINFLANGLKNSKFEDPIGGEVSIARATFIMTTSADTSYDDSNAKRDKVFPMKLLVEKTTPKRKEEWDLSNKAKKPRTYNKEDDSLIVIENDYIKKEFSRQLSYNTLDLNIQAEEEDNEKDKPEVVNVVDHKIPHGFLELIEDQFVFNLKSASLGQMKQNFMSKLEASFEEVCGSERVGFFFIDEVVLEEMIIGSGSFLANLFEKWLKDIFQTSLQTIKKGGNEGTVRLSLVGKEENVLEVGFMGSSLPKIIQVNFND